MVSVKIKSLLLLSLKLFLLGALVHNEKIFASPDEFSDKLSGPSANDLRLDSSLTLELGNGLDSPIYLLGNTIEGQIDEKISVENNAQFRKLGQSLSSDKLIYDLVESKLTADGNVVFFRAGELYTGPKMTIDPSTMQGFFEEVTYDFSRINGRGRADRVEFIRPKEVVLRNATFTTCPTDKPSWELRSAEIVVDDIRAVARTKNTALHWNGAELLPLGDLSFSISGERKSGLLAPTFSVNSKLGADLTVPYYLNIAPNRDLTLYPRLVGRRGAQIGADLRLLGKSHRSEFGIQILPADKIAKEDRWLGKLNSTYHFSKKKLVSINLTRVSDNDYFADFGASVLAASQRILPTTLQFSGKQGGWNYTGAYQGYQVLQDPGAPILPPYEWSPKFVFFNDDAFSLKKKQIFLELAAEATHFTHPTLTEGTRLIGKANVSTPLNLGVFRVLPSANLHYTLFKRSRDGSAAATERRFSLDPSLLGVYANNTDESKKSYERLIPNLSLEVSSVLERKSIFRGISFTNTIEPMLFYAFTPYHNQENFPVFDTTSVTSSLAQLLSQNSFFGDDRVADKNYLTAATTTRFIDENGFERMRASIAQRYYFDRQRVVLPGQPKREDDESDLFFETSIKPSRDLSISALGQYTRKLDLWQNQIIGLRFTPKPGEAFSFDYRFTRNSVDSADFAFQTSIGNSWYAVGRYNYSFQSRSEASGNQPPGLVEALLGLEYNGGCWVSRVVAQRYVTGSTEATTALFFQVELNGIARVGADPLNALKRGIPNYRRINQLAPSPSTFDNFR